VSSQNGLFSIEYGTLAEKISMNYEGWHEERVNVSKATLGKEMRA